MIIYNGIVALIEGYIKLSARWTPKNKLWVEGRKGILPRIRQAVGASERIIWFHAASVGEFEQGRPLIEAFRQRCPDFKVVLTFYSPSGYELRKNWKGADYIFYFPSDKPAAAREFIDAIHPEVAVIIKYEFWLNTLRELRRRGVRTYLVSAIFRTSQLFFKPWGGRWRQALGTFDTIFVQNPASKSLLSGIGVSNVEVAGDTRFDRVHQITQSAGSIPLVDKFCAGAARVFVAGSTWAPDEDLLIRLVRESPDVKFIIAPHEMDEARISRFVEAVSAGVGVGVEVGVGAEGEAGVDGGSWSGACRYSCPESVRPECQVLIVDTVGLLSVIYRYASWAYVGGGFGVGIHNTVEPASYGLPVAFGPNFKRFDEAVSMVGLGVACSVSNYDELAAWFRPLAADEQLRLRVCAAALDYTSSQLGATERIVKVIAGR